MTAAVLPGGTVGVLGSGQLGRMFAIAARRMGYRVHTYSPEYDTPTGQVADVEVAAPYEDLAAVRDFARNVDVVTFEFENVPAAAVDAAAQRAPVRPDGSILHTTQHRLREKTFLAKAGFPVTSFAEVRSPADLDLALGRIGYPAVLKASTMSYDGKGQSRIDAPGDAAKAWETLAGREAILEGFVPFEREASVVVARSLDGRLADFGLIENTHTRHILDYSVATGDPDAPAAREAVRLARAVAEALGVVGVLCVELFVAPEGRLLINELAPRPHNSGHLTVDACVTSQFEQQLRAVCGLPLGSTRYLQAAAMANLLGDLWEKGEPAWPAVCAFPDVKLHLYGKSEARPRRKMGHLTALADSAHQALARVLAAREALTPPA
ncbi:MAG: 5-(carboxyamino)imidazole ribonucleotide synthase [Acidobacteriota bacterium]